MKTIIDTTQGYLHDILAQPAALEATLKGLSSPTRALDWVGSLEMGQFQRLVLTGMGSSYHALYPLYLQLIQHGFPTWMVETSELVYYQSTLVDSHSLVVAVSQSGRSAEVIRLLDLAGERKASVLGVSNTAGSPLDQRSNACLLTQAGEEFSVSCKTYVSTLMALNWLGDCLCKLDLNMTLSELAQAAPAVGVYLADWQDYAAWLKQELNGVNHFILTGRGSSMAAVGTGGLIVKESTHVHGEGMSSAAFRHGPIEMLAMDVYVLVFAGMGQTAGLNRGLVDNIHQMGGRAALVDIGLPSNPYSLPFAPERLLPILEILPVEMATLALAALNDRAPGVFEHGLKVTTTE